MPSGQVYGIYRASGQHAPATNSRASRLCISYPRYSCPRLRLGDLSIEVPKFGASAVASWPPDALSHGPERLRSFRIARPLAAKCGHQLAATTRGESSRTCLHAQPGCLVVRR